ncbi:MAG: PHP-associated domain-containing protein [archaeon]
MENNTIPFIVDMHTHLNEKKVKPENWWREAKKKKLCAIAITEHSYYEPREAYLKLKEIQPKNILLIPGMEAKTTAGDLLLYGTNESIYDIKELQKINVSIEKVLRIAKKNNLLISFAHPYGYKLDSVCEVIGEKKAKQLVKKYGTGIEYYNGMLGSANELIFGRKWVKKFYGILSFVEKNKATSALKINKTTNPTKQKMESLAEETLNRVKKGMLFEKNASFITTGSDAHYPKSIGSSVIELKKKPKNEKELVEMIKKKEILWAGPNIYSKSPVDIIGKKEMVEGLTYLTKKKVLRKRKTGFASKISKKIRLGKRIKTIKRISKKVGFTKIKEKMPKFKLKKRIISWKKTKS